MSDGWIAFWAALGGAMAGGGAAIAASLVQQRGERRREFARLAFQAALEDFKATREQAAEKSKAGSYVKVYPLMVWIYHHWHVANLIDRGSFDAKSFEQVARGQRELMDALDTLNPPPPGFPK